MTRPRKLAGDSLPGSFYCKIVDLSRGMLDVLTDFDSAFLGTAAYLIFGSWLNYNRYGARGWDLLPHGDTIRDIPYLFKDWSRKVVDTVTGSQSRGGYSAV